jgi:epoxyqueuosine reductase
MLDDAGFRALFRKSPVKRIGRDRFLRNVMIAIGNSGDSGLALSAKAVLHDTSALVRGAAVWALSQLLSENGFATLAETHAASESDPQVRSEWLEPDFPGSRD